MKPPISKLAAIILIVIVISAGCNPGAVQYTPTLAPTATQPAPTAAPTATQPPATPTLAAIDLGSFKIGTYKNEKSDLQWVVLANGTFNVQSAEHVATGTFTVTGDKLTFTSNDCPGIIGSYTWTFEGNTMILKTVNDACSTREFNVTYGKWVKMD